MEIKLKQEAVPEFEQSMADLAPWMHSFKFSDEIIVGYYKYLGLGEKLTYCNSQSAPDQKQKLRDAYSKVRHSVARQFFKKIMDQIALPDRSKAVSLDISSATGEKSIWCVDEGFGRVISSEIRKNQCDQQRLIYRAMADPKYEQKIEVVHDTTSADVEEFSQRYKGEQVDVALSFGLLYHLANPVQHIVNLREITKRYAILQTLTNFSPLKKNLWSLEIENADWITKATSSVSWIPHFLEVPRLCRKLGFRRVQIVYPDLFEKNFPDAASPNRFTDVKLLAQIALNKFGIRTGHMKNFAPEYFRTSYLNPNYFAYILEK